MPFTSIYMLAMVVTMIVVGGIGYRGGGLRRACVSVICTFAVCLVLYAGFLVLRAGD